MKAYTIYLETKDVPIEKEGHTRTYTSIPRESNDGHQTIMLQILDGDGEIVFEAPVFNVDYLEVDR